MLNSKPINWEDKECTLLEKISSFIFHNDLVYFVRKQFRFVVRLIKWVPVLYKDEDWDYRYLLDIIDFKLQRMRKVIEQDDIHGDVPTTLKKLDVIRGRMDRYLNCEKYIGDYPDSFGNFEDMFEPTEDGHHRLRKSTPEEREYIEKSMAFELKNYKGFFKALEKYLPALWS